MRKRILAGVLLPITVLLAADLQPLNVKTGVWQVTMASTINGAPKPNVSTYKSCLTAQNLSEYPFTDPDAKCTWTVLSSTGSSMQAHGTCVPGNFPAKIDFNMKL